MGENRLENKTAWVTGSSRGIGRVIADHLAGLGAKIAVHGTSPTSTRAFNEAESLEAVARAIAENHGGKSDETKRGLGNRLNAGSGTVCVSRETNHRFGLNYVT